MGYEARTALVTGASRGVGAETAKLLAQRGVEVAVNYRDKTRHADKVVQEIQDDNGSAFHVQANITDFKAVDRMLEVCAGRWKRLDLLFLNASGGMEQNRSVDPMQLNCDAQVNMAESALSLMGEGGRIVFVTSNQAHFGIASVSAYAPIAVSKKAGEEASGSRAEVCREKSKLSGCHRGHAQRQFDCQASPWSQQS